MRARCSRSTAARRSTFASVEPYLGDAGDVPVWDLTDALDAGDAAKAIAVARRMLESRRRAGLQIVAALQRHYLNMSALEGSSARTKDEAAATLGHQRLPGRQGARHGHASAPRASRRRCTGSRGADLDLKGAVSYGGRDLESDLDVTELTVIEVLVARLARLSFGARRRARPRRAAR